MNTIKLNTIGEAPVKKVAGGGENFKYFSLSEYNDNDDVKYWACVYGQYIKYQWHQSSDDSQIPPQVSGKVSIRTGGGVYDLYWDEIDFLTVAVDMDARHYDEGDEAWFDPKSKLEMWSGVKFSDLKEISKEEFYEIPQIFTFKPSQVSDELKYYMYKEGQTWGEWVNSSYNTIGAYVDIPDGGGKEYINLNI